MRYHVLASDYDGTLAHHGRVDAETVAALRRLRDSGRLLVLVTGRELSELLMIFPEIDLFARVVAENGALLYRPGSKEHKLLCPPPPESFIEALKRRGVTPAVGRTIVATWRPHETAVLDTIRELGLDWQVIFNKDAVMALPGGVTKATGLLAALQELGMTPHEAVGVGDAENDHALLQLCEFGAAVANALEPLKERSDLATSGDHGVGVRELIAHMLDNDLAAFEERLVRHDVPLGKTLDRRDMRLPGYGTNLLICGDAKSAVPFATKLIERLVERRYQCCVLDAAHRFQQLQGVSIGDANRPPAADEVNKALRRPGENATVHLEGLSQADRRTFVSAFLTEVQTQRAQSGRPHWILIDPADELLQHVELADSKSAKRLLLMTRHVARLAPGVLANVDTALFLGAGAEDECREFCRALSLEVDLSNVAGGGESDCILWERRTGRMQRGRLNGDESDRLSTNLPS